MNQVERWAWVLYADENLWHQRMILGQVASTAPAVRDYRYVVPTPDADVYEEDFSGNDQAITAVRFSNAFGGLPAGLPRRHIYRFGGEPTPGQRDRYTATAEDVAREILEDRARTAGTAAPGPPFLIKYLDMEVSTPLAAAVAAKSAKLLRVDTTRPLVNPAPAAQPAPIQGAVVAAAPAVAPTSEVMVAVESTTVAAHASVLQPSGLETRSGDVGIHTTAGGRQSWYASSRLVS